MQFHVQTEINHNAACTLPSPCFITGKYGRLDKWGEGKWAYRNMANSLSLSLPLFPFISGEVLPATFSPPHLLFFSTLLCLLSSSSSLPPLLSSSHLSLHSPPISVMWQTRRVLIWCDGEGPFKAYSEADGFERNGWSFRHDSWVCFRWPTLVAKFAAPSWYNVFFTVFFTDFYMASLFHGLRSNNFVCVVMLKYWQTVGGDICIQVYKQ